MKFLLVFLRGANESLDERSSWLYIAFLFIKNAYSLGKLKRVDASVILFRWEFMPFSLVFGLLNTDPNISLWPKLIVQDESLLETGPWKDSDIIFLRICLGAVEEAILSFYMIL